MSQTPPNRGILAQRICEYMQIAHYAPKVQAEFKNCLGVATDQKLEELLRTFDKKFDRPMPRPELVVEPSRTNPPEQEIINQLIEQDIRRRLSQPGFKKHGMQILEIARCFLGTLEAFYKEVADKLGEEAMRKAERVLKQILLAETAVRMRFK